MFKPLEGLPARTSDAIVASRLPVTAPSSNPRNIVVFPQGRSDVQREDAAVADPNFNQNVERLLGNVPEGQRIVLSETIGRLPRAVYQDCISEIDEVRVDVRETAEEGAKGLYDVEENTITLSPFHIGSTTVLAHEIGHAVDYRATENCENSPYSVDALNDVFKEELAQYVAQGGQVISDENLSAPYFTLSVGEFAAELYKFENLSMFEDENYKLICKHFPRTRELLLSNIEHTRTLPLETRKGSYCASIEYERYPHGAVKTETKTHKSGSVFVTHFAPNGDKTIRTATYGKDAEEDTAVETYTNGQITGQQIVYKNGDVYTAKANPDGTFISESRTYGPESDRERVDQYYTNNIVTRVEIRYKNGDVRTTLAGEDGSRTSETIVYGSDNNKKEERETYDHGELLSHFVEYKTGESFYTEYSGGVISKEVHVLEPKEEEEDNPLNPREKITTTYSEGAIVSREIDYRNDDKKTVYYDSDGVKTKEDSRFIISASGVYRRVKTYTAGSLDMVQSFYTDGRVLIRKYNPETHTTESTTMIFAPDDDKDKLISTYSNGKIINREIIYKIGTVENVAVDE